MKKLFLSTIVGLFGLVAISGSALAAPYKLDLAKFKFKNNMKINVKTLKKNPLLGKIKVFDFGLNCSSYKKAENKAKHARSKYIKRYNYCKTKSYSIANQQAAGCKGSDSIIKCNNKLIKWCTKYRRNKYLQARAGLKIAAQQLIKKIKKRVAKYWIIL